MKNNIIKTILGLVLATSPLLAQYDMGLRYSEVITVPASEYPATAIEIEEKWGGQPVLFKGAAKEWGAMKWTPEYLAENFGEYWGEVGPQRVVVTDLDEGIEPLKVSIVDHVKDITENPLNAMYMLQDFDNRTTDVYDPFEFDSYNGFRALNMGEEIHFAKSEIVMEDSYSDNFGEPYQEVGFLIGSPYTVAGIHNHEAVQLALLSGKKVAFLIEEKEMYQVGCYDQYRDYCEDNDDGCTTCYEPDGNCECSAYVDMFCKSTLSEGKEFFDRVPVIVANIEAGDILFIPEKWGHEVHGQGDQPTVTLVASAR